MGGPGSGPRPLGGQPRWPAKDQQEAKDRLKTVFMGVAERVAVQMNPAVAEVLNEMKADVAAGFDRAYERAMADEQDYINKKHFVQFNPGDAVRASRPYVFSRDAVVKRGVTKDITVEAGLLSAAYMDSIPDRTSADLIGPVNIALPVRTTRFVPLRSRVRGALQRLLGKDDPLVYIKPLTIHGRTGHKVTFDRTFDTGIGVRPAKGQWKLWRALEYGQVSGRYGRVYVRLVVSYKPEVTLSYERTDTRKNPERTIKTKKTRILSRKSEVKLGDWMVFMSPRWKWWDEMSRLLGQEFIRVEAPGNAYSGGEHPIKNTLVQWRRRNKWDRVIGKHIKRGLRQ